MLVEFIIATTVGAFLGTKRAIDKHYKKAFEASCAESSVASDPLNKESNSLRLTVVANKEN